MRSQKIRMLSIAGMIAALYATLTYFSHIFGLAVGPFEFRLSEALCILPLFTPAAIPGLFCGCIAANLLCGALWVDVIFGAMASLLGALGTYYFRKKKMLPFLSPVFWNTVIIPPILYYLYGFQDMALPLLYGSFFVGEAGAVFGFGFLLKKALKGKKILF